MTTETLWIGASLTFQNNNDIVVVNTGDDIQSIEPNDVLFSSNYGEPVEVASAYITADASPVTVIKLTKPWPGGSGNFSATIVPSGTSIAAVAKKLNTLHDTYSALAQNVSNIVTGDSLVQRLNDGRVKGANAEDNDDLVAKGQFNALAQSYVSGYGVGEDALPAFTDWNAIPYPFNGMLRIQTGAVNAPSGLPTNYYYNVVSLGNSNANLLVMPIANEQDLYLIRRSDATTFTLLGNAFGYIDHGIGAEFGAAWPNGTDLNNTTGVRPGVYKIYAVTPTEALGFPSEYTANANVTIIFNIEASTRMTMILSDAKTGETFVRAYNGSWKPYRKLFDSTNSANPLDFGFCIPADANAPVITATQADTTMLPTSAGRGQLDNGIFTTFINLRANLNRQAQFHMAYGGGEPRAFARMMVGDFQWSDIIEFYTDHNSANPLDYGIGGVKTLPSGTSLLSIAENGLYYIPSATNAPSAQTPNWVVLVNSTNNAAYRTVKAWGVGKIAGSYGEYTNTLENTTWGGWRLVYDSGNTNFNSFSAESANDIIAYGYAVTSGIVQLFFPLNSKTAPTSLSVTGTFKLKGAADADRATGITTLGLKNLSTNKLGVCRVSSGLTGVVQGEPIVLVATASGDSVTFNF